jgi:glutaredoxin 3
LEQVVVPGANARSIDGRQDQSGASGRGTFVLGFGFIDVVRNVASAPVLGAVTFRTREGSTGMTAIQIYTTSYCGYCFAAKRLLSRRGLAFEEINVSRSGDVREWLTTTTGRRTVPQIFIAGVPIGGYQELAALDRSGELERLTAAQAEPPDGHASA